MNTFHITFLVFAFSSLFNACGQVERHRTETTVLVLDELGVPLSGANVRITYRQFRPGEYETGRGLSDEEGLFSFVGMAMDRVTAEASLKGYYATKGFSMVRAASEDGKGEWLNPTIELVLKRIKDPVAMYARRRLFAKVPKFNEPLGYDLLVLDWIPPYGIGKQADVVFEVNGYYNSEQDRKSTLVIRFPNKGDGMIPFDGNYRWGSELISPQQAPEEGYVSEYTYSRSVFDSGEKYPGGMAIIKSTGAKEISENFIFRIRTLFDDSGEIEKAFYGKFYAAFDFDGVWYRESAIALGDYYLNPVSLHRSLEYEVGSNLFEDLRSVDEPGRP